MDFLYESFKWCYCYKILRYKKLWNTFYFWSERMIYEDWMRYLKKQLERELWVFELRKNSDYFKHEKNVILQFQWRCNSFCKSNFIINLKDTSYVEIMQVNNPVYNEYYFLSFERIIVYHLRLYSIFHIKDYTTLWKLTFANFRIQTLYFCRISNIKTWNTKGNEFLLFFWRKYVNWIKGIFLSFNVEVFDFKFKVTRYWYGIFVTLNILTALTPWLQL